MYLSIILLTIFGVIFGQNANNCFDLISGMNTTRVRQGIPTSSTTVSKSTFTVFYSNNTFYEINLENTSIITGGNYTLFEDKTDKTICHLLRNTTDINGLKHTECETLIPFDLKSSAIRGLAGCLDEPDKPQCLSSCYYSANVLNQDLVSYYDNGPANKHQVQLDLSYIV